MARKRIPETTGLEDTVHELIKLGVSESTLTSYLERATGHPECTGCQRPVMSIRGNFIDAPVFCRICVARKIPEKTIRKLEFTNGRWRLPQTLKMGSRVWVRCYVRGR